MNTLAWRGFVIVALLSTYLWGRGAVAGLREERRLDRKRVEHLERMLHELPTLIRTELAYHRDDLLTRLEAANDK